MKENMKFENERLAKYEIKTGEFDIDIYLSHYSDLGVDIAEIEENAVIKDGFCSKPELLFLLKLFAWDNRRGTAKGRKDELDVFCLARLPEFDWKYYRQMVKKYAFEEQHRRFIKLLKTTKEIKELAINQQKMAKLRKDILKKLPE